MKRVSNVLAHFIDGMMSAGGANPTKLTIVDNFGSNPGRLAAYLFVPKGLEPGAPLVVILHGCGQTAAGYDQASGWSRLAEEQGFALLYPEQQRSNNPNGCFNWFEPQDARRDAGEALSIRQMIATVADQLAIDPKRVFITGLSAGGAMAATMLAIYPEIFAGGGIIAGLPHGSAKGMAQAFERMRGLNMPTRGKLQDALRKASSHTGPWPRISIWHGGSDTTVSLANAGATLSQWLEIHGLTETSPAVDRIDHVPHRSWHGTDGRILVEDYLIPGMGHGTPLKIKGAGAYGASAPFMLDVDVSSTLRIAQFWEIANSAVFRSEKAQVKVAERAALPAVLRAARPQARRIEPKWAPVASGIGKVIEDALKAAGLMK